MRRDCAWVSEDSGRPRKILRDFAEFWECFRIIGIQGIALGFHRISPFSAGFCLGFAGFRGVGGDCDGGFAARRGGIPLRFPRILEDVAGFRGILGRVKDFRDSRDFVGV